MAPSSSPPPPPPPPFLHSAGRCMQSLTASILSHLPFLPPILPNHRTDRTPTPPSPAVTIPFVLPSFPSPQVYTHANREESSASPSPGIRTFSSSVRMDGLSSTSTSKGGGAGGGGPAFVGQVFSMLDPSGNGLMAVTSHLEIPFLSKR